MHLEIVKKKNEIKIFKNIELYKIQNMIDQFYQYNPFLLTYWFPHDDDLLF